MTSSVLRTTTTQITRAAKLQGSAVTDRISLIKDNGCLLFHVRTVRTLVQKLKLVLFYENEIKRLSPTLFTSYEGI